MISAFVVTVPTVWLVLAICLVVLAAWLYFVSIPMFRVLNSFFQSNLDNWAEKEKAKINEKYGQVDRHGE